jgi:hypothetical protein
VVTQEGRLQGTVTLFLQSIDPTDGSVVLGDEVLEVHYSSQNRHGPQDRAAAIAACNSDAVTNPACQ